MLTRYHESKGENRIPQEEHKDVFQEPVWSFYYGGTVKFIPKKINICRATKQKRIPAPTRGRLFKGRG